MLVRCIESFRQQIKAGNLYLVIEILIKRTSNSVSYRVIDDEGYPAIYDAEKFVIVSDSINNFAISWKQDHMVFSPVRILHSELNEKCIEGFWGLYMEDDPAAKALLEEVVKDLTSEI